MGTIVFEDMDEQHLTMEKACRIYATSAFHLLKDGEGIVVKDESEKYIVYKENNRIFITYNDGQLDDCEEGQLLWIEEPDKPTILN